MPVHWMLSIEFVVNTLHVSLFRTIAMFYAA